MKNYHKELVIACTILAFLILIMLFLVYKRLVDNTNEINNQINVSDKITYTAYFKTNGATSVSEKKITCELVNNYCLITMPIAVRENGTILGYHVDKNSKEALYNIYQTINLTSDMTFYVISFSELNLKIMESELDYLSNKNNSCVIYNEEKSCTVKIPFYNKEGYEVRGYSTNESSSTGHIYPNSEYKIKSDTILYPIYNTLTRNKVIGVNKTLFVDEMVIDVENGCSENIYNKYLVYLKKINIKAPYLSIGNKITFLNSNTFDDIWGTSYVGMNYGPKNLRLIDVRCSSSVLNNYYATLVHEMAHSWDFYYSNYFGKDIAEQSDIVNLFNKYSNSELRPFREYSYTNIREFFADMVRYYYLKYTDPINEYKNLSYPSDIKKVLEKYICISNNNYNKSSC